MIRTFRDKLTEQIFEGESPKRLSPDISRRALRRLIDLDNAVSPTDLMVPPSNHLEQLKGDRQGMYSIRVNDRYRICFSWREGNAYDVEFVDYH
ncbi:MAG: type II toxin-antitoxin system RelE/ParE family toxin [Spirochaetes bacterium]|uniref:Type II toxin-antitoxin system RelE/ParE family toxin n=1 Tax=Candidatus Aphodenecus pullistercoris TaxID=2840669 RepID=A0A9D9HAW4_9SPIR|nr:type II toxin-antitoxin system RelE/ParE family toxin [Candidatus Aphodenecus pullistercoris]